MNDSFPVDDNLRQSIITELKRKKLFWSYDLKPGEDIPDSLLLETVLIYGDLPELEGLKYLFSDSKIESEISYLLNLYPQFKKELTFAKHFLLQKR
ncbi:MAG TPA: hypothetical protein VFU05_20390 [Cyclobacteriaceae bacterium]|nr:hypothetical protein [Cyclobacteriaceae bacterium]